MNSTETNLRAIPCNEALEKFMTSDFDKQSIRENFGGDIDKFVCPDSPSFELWERVFLSYDDAHFNSIGFHVAVKEGHEERARNTFIQMSFNFPYFDADDYRTNGGNLKWSNNDARYSYLDDSGTRP